MNDRYRWGIDLGGTKIEAVILDSAQENQVIARQRVPTLSAQGYKVVLAQIKKLMSLMTEQSGLHASSLGIGTPGRLDPETQTLKNSNSTCLNGQTFLKDLQDLLAIPVKIENDANCFALSEASYLLANGYSSTEVIVGIILGTGVGGGIVMNGKTISGIHGIGGEWGHNFLDASGGPCYCGKTGCVETIISGPALERHYFECTGNRSSLKEINELYEKGDTDARQTIERLHYFFGLGISQVLNILDPAAVVIGGGVGNVPSLYTEGVKQVRKFIFNDKVNTKFLKPKYGDSSGVFGAALL